MAEAYQSLYRRYRSKRFDELKGQDHVVRALRTAVSEDRVGHAYLFSGPRGTGKTSTARILAKVLNCEAPKDGEPCGVCPNCEAVDQGRIVDWLLELDAASNNGVANIRDLIDRIPLGTSGNRKVVILDEVHMLSTGAANALLKSLEEPPAHVVFILATTDPQKVLPTIRSRTQHFEFHLLPADVLADHVRHVIADAGLDLGEDAVTHVVRQGGGSARDTLSALDQVSAMGGVVEQAHPVEAILQALVARDAGAALVAVADATEAGRDPRALGEVLIGSLRDAFLSVMGAPDRHLPEADAEQAATLGAALGAGGLTRALEVLGEALVELAKKPDPRIVLEVALVRLCRPEADRSLDAVIDRLERLERAVASGSVGTAPPAASAAAPSPATSAGEPAAGPPDSASAEAGGGAVRAPASPGGASAAPVSPAGDDPAGGARGGPAAEARAELAKITEARGGARPRVTKATAPRAAAAPKGAPPVGPGPAASEPAVPQPPAAGATGAAGPPAGAGSTGGVPSRDELTLVWGDKVLDTLPRGTKAIFSTGRFVDGDGTSAVFALANAPTRDHCEKKRADVERALEAHFGRPVPLRLVTDAEVGDGGPTPGSSGVAGAAARRPPAGGARPEPDPEPDGLDGLDVVDVHELEDAPAAGTGAERLAEAFPGSELVEEP